MKKITNYKTIFASLAIIAAITSCNDDDVNYAKVDKPTVSITSQSSTSIEEGESTTITLTADQAYKDDMEFKVELASGSTAMNSDFYVGSSDDITGPGDGLGDAGYVVTIPAYQTTATFDITATDDLFPEGTENVVLNFRNTGNGTAIVEAASSSISFDITNKVQTNDDLIVILDWSGSFNAYDDSDCPSDCATEESHDPANFDFDACMEACDVSAHDFCDLDFDLEVYGPSFYSSYYNCPEEDVVILEGDADGQYDVYAEYYSNAAGYLTPGDVSVPVKIIVAKKGVFYQEIDLSSAFLVNDNGVAEGNPNWFTVGLSIIKTGTSYELVNPNTGDTIATGKNADFVPHGRN